MKEEIIPFKKYTEGDFIHEIRRLNRVVSKLSEERDNLQSQLKAKEEVIKEASEYNQEIVDDYLGKYDCEYCDGRYATATHNLEILSKGENK